MTRDEMLNKLHALKFCIFWPGDWEDLGYTERPIWASSVGYGYYACDEPCLFKKIENVPNDVVRDIKEIVSVCFQFKKVLKYKHLRLICDIIGAKKQRVNAQKPCT